MYSNYLEDPSKHIPKSTRNRRRRQQLQYYDSDDNGNYMWRVS